MPRREGTITLTAEEIPRFVEAAARREESRRFETLFLLGLWTGMRPGELLGVLWDDMELPTTPGESGQVDVRRALSETKKHGIVPRGMTKTGEAGRRVVTLVPEVVAVLREHRRRQAEEKVRYRGLMQDLKHDP